jgi:hypothetical protein
VIGRVYLLRGERVVVRERWRKGAPRGVPRNVLVELPDGTLTVRPFRGLRRVKDGPRARRPPAVPVA